MRLLSARRRPNPSPTHIHRREEGTNRKRELALPTLTYLLIAARLSYSSQGIRTELSRWSTPAGPARPQHGPVSPACVAGVTDTVDFVYLWPAGAWFPQICPGRLPAKTNTKWYQDSRPSAAIQNHTAPDRASRNLCSRAESDEKRMVNWIGGSAH